MDDTAYFVSLTDELHALQSRVRDLLSGAHGPSDGDWKESILRAVIRRHLPATIGMGTGFIVDRGAVSSQIDLLLYDSRHPLLFADGDFVVVAPPAVRGIVEVKSKVRSADLQSVLEKLVKNAGIAGGGPESKFVALFAFDFELGASPDVMLLEKLRASIANNHDAVVTHVCLGKSSFTKFFAVEPGTGTQLDRWRTFHIDGQAPGYFVANALRAAVGNTIDGTEWGWFEAFPPTEAISLEG